MAHPGNEMGDNYNLACYYSMVKEPVKALAYLDKSLKLGWDDYNHIKVDSDLDNLRNLEQFKSMMRTYFSNKLSPEDYLIPIVKGSITLEEYKVQVEKGTALMNNSKYEEALKHFHAASAIDGSKDTMAVYLAGFCACSSGAY
jgi:tetratricopeptide (TPR) repeat protein